MVTLPRALFCDAASRSRRHPWPACRLLVYEALPAPPALGGAGRSRSFARESVRTSLGLENQVTSPRPRSGRSAKISRRLRVAGCTDTAGDRRPGIRQTDAPL